MSEPTERPLRALVLEDERPARNYLVELLHDTERVSVVAAVASAEQASQALAEVPTLGSEAAFVDVRLAGSRDDRAGLRWLSEVAERPSPPRFVLTTASPDHALDGYRLGVVDYLLKPFTAERVEATVQRLLAQRAETTRVGPVSAPRIVARDGRGLVFLAIDEILAFESQARLTFVHSTRGRFDLDLSLAAVEVALAGQPLLRVHRSWVVHLPMVSGLERADGETSLTLGRTDPRLEVPVARERVMEVRERLVETAIGLRRGS